MAGKLRISIGLRAAAALSLAAVGLAPAAAMAQDSRLPDSQRIRLRWGQKIPLRDGVQLSAALYLPREDAGPAPCIVTMTPYTAQSYHDRGVYFAARGMPFFSIDVRGRGLSEGTFRPFIQEADDAADVVEWVAKQPYCNGKVAMWGGSYAGYLQWGAAKHRPPHLATIVPVASPFMGVDVPGRGNIQSTALLPAGIWISGRTMQTMILADQPFWNGVLRERFEKGEPYATLDSAVSDPSLISQPIAQWAANPTINAYWDAYVPTDAELAAIDIPVLSITGIYDSLQLGSIAYFRKNRSATTAGQRRYLVIGPWDHNGTRAPRPDIGGVKVGKAGLLDLSALHLEWYRWTMAGGPRPAFLEKPVAYYVMGADRWRYADTLEDATQRVETLKLASVTKATGIDAPGLLGKGKTGNASDSYVYDPRDVSGAVLETRVDPASLVDTRLVAARAGKQLVYEGAPFPKPTEISGFFKLSAWISIDRPDTDFQVAVYEVSPSGDSILLTSDQLRARYRNSVRRAELLTTTRPVRYEFGNFTFTSRQVAAGNRLRLVIGPINSIYSQKNYNSGGDVASESVKDARPVTVRLWHDARHPSVLHVPIGEAENDRPLNPHIRSEPMKLYGAMLSPYVIRVVLVARAKGAELDPIHPPGEGPEREAYLRVNPGGKMPFLEDGDFSLIESAVIADYLDATLPGPSLWPSEPRARARAALLARLVDVWIAPGVSAAMLAIRDELPASVRDEGWAKLTGGLKLMSHYRAADDIWLAGDSFGHADAAMIPWFFSAECFNGESGIGTYIAENHPDLAAYWSRVKETGIGARICADMDARARLLFAGSIRNGPKTPAQAAAMTAQATNAAAN